MNKKSVENISASGCRILVRADFNVPLDDHGRITDDRRIRAALPTIQKLVGDGGRIILMSHLGRPKDDDQSRLSLAPVATRLAELLNQPVPLIAPCVGQTANDAANALKNGQVVLLENLRFEKAETFKDKNATDAQREQKIAFARQLADLGDIYVNDAFGTCHRDNASMVTLPSLMKNKPRVSGYLLQKELNYLGQAVAKPKRPFVCVLGGAKVSDKITVIRSLLTKCDKILIGGAMAFTFLNSEGVDVGRSLVEPDLLETARQLRQEAGDRILLPVDTMAADAMETDAQTQICPRDIPHDMMGLDIGPATVQAFTQTISNAGTVVWNGPMGVFEIPPFDVGTNAIASALVAVTKTGATTIVGGGDSAAAINSAGLADKVSHVSTGGGASLEFLEGKTFQAVDILDEA